MVRKKLVHSVTLDGPNATPETYIVEIIPGPNPKQTIIKKTEAVEPTPTPEPEQDPQPDYSSEVKEEPEAHYTVVLEDFEEDLIKVEEVELCEEGEKVIKVENAESFKEPSTSQADPGPSKTSSIPAIIRKESSLVEHMKTRLFKAIVKPSPPTVETSEPDQPAKPETTKKYDYSNKYLYEPFECELCPKGFKKKGKNLFLHQQIYCKARYKCKKCDFMTNNQIYLHDHEKIHFDCEFECGICGKGFYRKASLLTHMDVHETEKRFGCGQCDKFFKSEKILVEHIKNLHCKLIGFKWNGRVGPLGPLKNRQEHPCV